MLASQDLVALLEKIDEEIIALLAERVAACQEAAEEDADAMGGDLVADVIAYWDSAADEHGWNPAVVMKLARAVHELCRQSE